ncbi:DNA primase [Aphanothece hegewaldii CCALA 016]|uniref:DNA primase n=1 Tax=Aphanothece hegewaldii CCALA 016 TaxID=2107694 RepID=A0A2T1LVC5_9CHRO|nr:DNA primase [Aphanothece hegewaldii]PSF35566.1 DNA primase [Aphanothece hegewaldii CCALA 016]
METPRIHPETLEEVKQRVDIVEIISEHVVLKKQGKSLVGLCPFHSEKSPSFSVNPSKQLYYCFGCGAGGNSIKFLMELEKQSFSEVVLDLARRYQIPLKTLDPQQRQEIQKQLSLKEQLYEILAVATSFYQHALNQTQGENAADYLKNKRHLLAETIQEFKLGYAPPGWETLYRYLVEQKHYPVDLVVQAGLIKPRQNGSGYYDQFRERLMIPIADIQGRIIGFGSRSLGDEKPKYLNSPETILFDKSKTLFALDKARQRIIKEDNVIVVEGYFDAIALHEQGITNVVASLGTAFGQMQLKQLLKYTESKQVILNFDGDQAGKKATQRAITEMSTLVYSGQVNLKILNLPQGKDADEFLKSSATAKNTYQELIQKSPLWIDWQIKELLLEYDLKKADQFKAIAQNMVKLLQKLEEQNQRSYYIRHCAEILAQGESRIIPIQYKSLLTQLKKPQSRSLKPSSPTFVTNSERNLLEEAEEELLLIYLYCPEHREEILQLLEEKDLVFSLSHHRFLWQIIDQLSLESSADLLSRLQNRLLSESEKIDQLAHFFHLTKNRQEVLFRAEVIIKNAIAALERVSWEKYRHYCLQQWQSINKQEKPDLCQYYFQEFSKADNYMKKLDELRINQAENVS